MDIDSLTAFFMWCTIINAGMMTLFFLVTAFGFGIDFVYKIHSRWFPMSRDSFSAVLYLLIGIYKIFVFVFNLVPWIVLLIIY